MFDLRSDHCAIHLITEKTTTGFDFNHDHQISTSTSQPHEKESSIYKDHVIQIKKILHAQIANVLLMAVSTYHHTHNEFACSGTKSWGIRRKIERSSTASHESGR